MTPYLHLRNKQEIGSTAGIDDDQTTANRWEWIRKEVATLLAFSVLVISTSSFLQHLGYAYSKSNIEERVQFCTIFVTAQSNIEWNKLHKIQLSSTVFFQTRQRVHHPLIHVHCIDSCQTCEFWQPHVKVHNYFVAPTVTKLASFMSIGEN